MIRIAVSVIIIISLNVITSTLAFSPIQTRNLPSPRTTTTKKNIILVRSSTRIKLWSQLCAKSSDEHDDRQGRKQGQNKNKNIDNSDINVNKRKGDTTNHNDTTPSILPPYRSTNTSDNNGDNKKGNYSARKWNRERSKLKRPMYNSKSSQNISTTRVPKQVNKRNDTISSPSASILPPPPTATTINDFRSKQRKKMQLRRSNSRKYDKKKRFVTEKQSQKLNRPSDSSLVFDSTIPSSSPISSSPSSILPPSSFKIDKEGNLADSDIKKGDKPSSSSSSSSRNDFLSDNGLKVVERKGTTKIFKVKDRQQQRRRSNIIGGKDDFVGMKSEDNASSISSIDDLPPPSYLFGKNNNVSDTSPNKSTLLKGEKSTTKQPILGDDDKMKSTKSPTLSNVLPVFSNDNYVGVDNDDNGVDNDVDDGGGDHNDTDNDTATTSSLSSDISSFSSSLPSLDGVLPVSELFYRSTQSLSADEDNDEEEEDNFDINEEYETHNDRNNQSLKTNKKKHQAYAKNSDDEELPFSAEQSDSIHTKNNKICIRRNNASSSNFSIDNDSDSDKGNNEDKDDQDEAKYKTDIAKLRSYFASSLSSTSSSKSNQLTKAKNKRRKRNVHTTRNNRSRNKKNDSKGRKMVRRGMEMLVGGEPINADPPQRCVELNYCFETANKLAGIGNDTISPLSSQLLQTLSKDVNENDLSLFNDWASVITTNSRDFGPLLHKPSVQKVSLKSRQIYCEHFVNACMKWQVCAIDLKGLAKSQKMNQLNKKRDMKGSRTSSDEYEQLLKSVTEVSQNEDTQFDEEEVHEKNDSLNDSLSKTSFRGFGKSRQIAKTNESLGVDINPKRGTFQPVSGRNDKNNRASRRSKMKDSFTLGGELKFTLGLTREDIESINNRSFHILQRVLGKGVATAIKAESLGFNVAVAKLLLNEIDGDATEFNVEFDMVPIKKMQYEKVEQVAKSINSELAHAMDYGDMALAMGAAVKAETALPARVRKRIVEEFLFDDDDDDEPVSDTDSDDNSIMDEESFEFRQEAMGCQDSEKETVDIDLDDDIFDGPFGMPGDTIYAKDDIFLGGGNGGVFADYSEASLDSAPWQGDLGPLLVDATIQRALQRQPRVIAIGDVHGCLDELQALLRRCDYRPGDLIIFLGDLVSKGPDSLAVVQLARELGAMGVRGNHDFEVIRWHQAIKSGKI